MDLKEICLIEHAKSHFRTKEFPNGFGPQNKETNLLMAHNYTKNEKVDSLHVSAIAFIGKKQLV